MAAKSYRAGQAVFGRRPPANGPGQYLVETFRDVVGGVELATVGNPLASEEEAFRLARGLASSFDGVVVWKVVDRQRTAVLASGRVPPGIAAHDPATIIEPSGG